MYPSMNIHYYNNFTNATTVKAMPERKIFSLGVRVKSLNVMW